MSDASDAERMPADDAHLLSELGQALSPDDPPAGLADRAEGLLDLMRVDSELAALLDEEAALAGTRGPAAAIARLEFEASDSSVSVEVVIERDRLAGQVLAGAVTEVTLERLGGEGETSAVDELGRFSFGHVHAGPARLRLRTGTARPVTTDWFPV